MDNLNSINKEHPVNSYNTLPVFYCSKCLSLRIMVLDEDTDYCDDCGCTDIESTNIDSWTDKYIKKFGKPFINK